MYQIRQYYTVCGALRCHIYNDYDNFQDAYCEFEELYKKYKFYYNIEEIVFVPHITKSKIEGFVKYYSKLGKDIITIYKEEIK